MKIKTFYAMNPTKLDKQVNEFLDRSDIDVEDIRYSASAFYFSVLVRYREKGL